MTSFSPAQASPRIAFIGGGNMATALARGFVQSGLCQPASLHIVDPGETTRDTWQAYGADTAAGCDARLADCKVWFFAVKPQNMRAAIDAARPFLQADTLVVSIAAGLRADTLAGWLGTAAQPWTRLVRSMPNTPSLVGAGATGLAALSGVTDADRAWVGQLFGAVGKAVWVRDDEALDAVTGLSGSGPAYVFLFLESLIQGGIDLGLDAVQARELALATVQGACALASRSEDPLHTLREKVTSKGGTTAAALGSFEADDFGGMVRRAMAAAAERARQMSRELA